MNTKSLEKRSEAAPPETKRRAKEKPSSRRAWFERPWVRVVASILLALHLTAVFVAPADAPPTPRSELYAALHEFFRPYLNVAYLNHGYGFFSPNPGSSFIIRYHIERKDGKQIDGVLPDLDEHWPRLLYHRHFMLTSQVRLLPQLPESYLKHLQKKHDARSVRLEYVEHRPATAEEVREGVKLDNPRTYTVVGTATIDAQGRIQVGLVEPPRQSAPNRPAPRGGGLEEVPAVAVPAGGAGGRR